MSKIYFQGTYGAYSHLASLSIDPKAQIIPCKTFDECFLKASKDDTAKIVIPESNRITGNIGIEYLIFKYRLNIYSEYFQKIEHNLLGIPGSKISEIKNVYSHAQALSQCSKFIKKNSLIEHVRADTAGSAEMIAKNKDKREAAIASSLSAETYSLEVIKKNIENEPGNLTRFLVMGKKIFQPEFTNKNYITTPVFRKISIKILNFIFSFLFKKKISYATCGFKAFKVNILKNKLMNFNKKKFYSYAFVYYFFGKVLISNKIKHCESSVMMRYPKKGKYSHIRPFLDWFTILFGSALGGWLAGSGTAVLIVMIYKKFNLHIVMILPILLTIFGLYKEVTYANEMGWGLIPFGALIRIVICISALFYLLRDSSQKREYQEKIKDIF